MKTFEEYVKQGESHDVMDALILLTQAYISQCGISLGLNLLMLYRLLCRKRKQFFSWNTLKCFTVR